MITIKRSKNTIVAKLVECDKVTKNFKYSYKDCETAGCVAAELKEMIKNGYGFVAVETYMIYQML